MGLQEFNIFPTEQPRARLTLVIEVGISTEEIRQLVHLIDEDHSGPGEGIAPEHVTAGDFFSQYYAGNYSGNVYYVVETMEDLK